MTLFEPITSLKDLSPNKVMYWGIGHHEFCGGHNSADNREDSVKMLWVSCFTRNGYSLEFSSWASWCVFVCLRRVLPRLLQPSSNQSDNGDPSGRGWNSPDPEPRQGNSFSQNSEPSQCPSYWLYWLIIVQCLFLWGNCNLNYSW